MAIFGRRTARQRLRKATEESLTIPAFSAPPDCTPWVIGGLWPADLSLNNAETAALTEYLTSDLQRIANSANGELRSLRAAVMLDSARRAAEARVIHEARAQAVRRVESTLRQLHEARGMDRDQTQVLPAVQDDQPAAEPLAREQQPDEPAAPTPEHPRPPLTQPEADDQRLQRLLTFVARQEPRLNWAVGLSADGTTVLVTDVAHGWLPPGIRLPEGVRLLKPRRRSGGVTELIGTTTRLATYRPGDPLAWACDFRATQSSEQPRELPTVDNLDRELSEATRRDGLPRAVHILANAAAAGADLVGDEIDLLRVHLDTARHGVVAQYPSADPALLLNCMLLAATESKLTGDPVAANYHLAWFRELHT
ncbi:vegetative cell wall protein precursor [Mycobacterium simiae]|uniref:Vegetative cell wall protein n=1 Tax=Mycobacterium simiae TaxID=1784 RepID=A0A5B1BIF8_MYCSI|nr:DUF5632 domain-containing protein [Mycobacterium simiae]KAA1248438.1 vegetative cell wall protein precursor [Mycobacterium simiae]